MNKKNLIRNILMGLSFGFLLGCIVSSDQTDLTDKIWITKEDLENLK